MRCAPHDEDTGGFFVAAFRKLGNVTPPAISSSIVENSTADNDVEPVQDEDAEVEGVNDESMVNTDVAVFDETPTASTSAQQRDAQSQIPNMRGTSEYVLLDDGAFSSVSMKCCSMVCY